jgi:hypothetical protein
MASDSAIASLPVLPAGAPTATSTNNFEGYKLAGSHSDLLSALDTASPRSFQEPAADVDRHPDDQHPRVMRNMETAWDTKQGAATMPSALGGHSTILITADGSVFTKRYPV